ncbi:hypothetical protein DFH09DRAFT_330897 [Mycena vulgaris]|nr:hypothetical protein DFH09DRAFT_330897 [Mycena vulgaris]
MYQNSLNLDPSRKSSESSASTKPVPETTASSRPSPPNVPSGPDAPPPDPPAPSASPALTDLLTLMHRQTRVLKSTHASSSAVPSSAHNGSTARPQPRDAEDVPSTLPASPPGPATREPDPHPAKAPSHPPSDRTPSSAASSHQQHSLLQAFATHLRRSESCSAASPMVDVGASVDLHVRPEEVSGLPPIATLRAQYAKCYSEGAAQRKTNQRWTVEAGAAEALIAALTMENERLRSIFEWLDPNSDNAELYQKEEGPQPEGDPQMEEQAQRVEKPVVDEEDVIEDVPMPATVSIS